MDRDAYFDSLHVDEPIIGSALGPFELKEQPIFEWVEEFPETEGDKPTKIYKQVGVVWTMH